MNELLASHSISPTLLREDDFDGFIADRRNQLIGLITKAMGKEVEEQGEYE